jgi:hypothetical protein
MNAMSTTRQKCVLNIWKKVSLIFRIVWSVTRMDESMKATMTNPGGEYDSKTWKTKDPREIRRDFA